MSELFVPLPVPGFPVGAPLRPVASAGPAGFTLVNGTPTILAWTCPSDIPSHRLVVCSSMQVGSLQTGGAVTVTWKDPGGTSRTSTIYAGGLAAGLQLPSPLLAVAIQGGQPVTVAQSSALTGGSGVAWFELLVDV